ncbi:MAG: thermonuclease family protein [Candidatus Margulisiibacteriota bacterium]|jgi:endonuclease YncB( thermonuclease family)
MFILQRFLVIIFCLLIAFTPVNLEAFIYNERICQVCHFATDFEGRVIQIIDGDTFVILMSPSKFKIRLWGIDSPEFGQAYGAEAKSFITKLCDQKKVKIRIIDIDKYQRKVALVLLANGQNLNTLMVKNGFAWWYPKYAPNCNHLQKAQNYAQKKGLGLWSQVNPVAPWIWRNAQEGADPKVSF